MLIPSNFRTNFRFRRSAALCGGLLVVALLFPAVSRSGQANPAVSRIVKHKPVFHRQPGIASHITCIRLTPNDPNCQGATAIIDKGTHTSLYIADTANIYVNIDRDLPAPKAQSQVRVSVYDVNESDNGPVLTISRFLQPSQSAFSLEKGEQQIILKTISQRPANVHAVMIMLNATDTDQKPLSISAMLTFPQR